MPMGAWGIGTYQNDSALDFVGIVLDSSFEDVYNVERALVWVDMVILFEEMIKPYQYNHIRELIEEDLDNIDNWVEECQEERKQLLHEYLQLLDSIELYEV